MSQDNMMRKQRSTKLRIQESKQKRSESQLSKVPYTSGKHNSQYDNQNNYNMQAIEYSNEKNSMTQSKRTISKTDITMTPHRVHDLPSGKKNVVPKVTIIERNLLGNKFSNERSSQALNAAGQPANSKPL